jgi:RNA polymerase sigma-70 factor, ECF subfamily
MTGAGPHMGFAGVTRCPEVAAPSDEFADFYHAHFRSLALQLCAYTGDLGYAQELAQEAFCRAFARWSAVSSYENPEGWVGRVAWNLAASRRSP